MPPLVENLSNEKRKHQRVRVRLLGRYMLADHNEYACQTIDMSPGGIAFAAPVSGEIGERVVCYLEEIGRVEGNITRVIDGGFCIGFIVTERKREKLAEKLTWLANRASLNIADGRTHNRHQPDHRETVVTFNDGKTVGCSIVDLSLGGASIAFNDEIDVAVGTQIRLGRTIGHVVRRHESGVSIRFVGTPDLEGFNANVA